MYTIMIIIMIIIMMIPKDLRANSRRVGAVPGPPGEQEPPSPTPNIQ